MTQQQKTQQQKTQQQKTSQPTNPPSKLPLAILIVGMFIFMIAIMSTSVELARKTLPTNPPAIITKIHSTYLSGINQLLLIYLFVLVIMYMIGMPLVKLFVFLNIGVSLTLLILSGDALRNLNKESAPEYKPYKELMKALLGISIIVFVLSLVWLIVLFYKK